MTNASRAPLAGRPLGPGAPEHQVKFRVAAANHPCDSQLCPEPNGRIQRGTKYARVMRPGRKIEFFHAKCYDDEFDQGGA